MEPLPMPKRFMPILIAALTLAVWSEFAQAQRLYRWVDEKGNVTYTDKMPVESAGRPADILNKQGTMLKRQEGALTPEQAEERERQQKKSQEEELAAREERRKNIALINTYASEQDIDESRERALTEANEAIQAIDGRIAEAKKRQLDYDREKEFYQKKSMPQKLQTDIRNNELLIKNQTELLEAKKKEIGTINAKYDADKRRYIELTKGGKSGAAASQGKK
jgi:hypothetical protein